MLIDSLGNESPYYRMLKEYNSKKDELPYPFMIDDGASIFSEYFYILNVVINDPNTGKATTLQAGVLKKNEHWKP